MKKIQTYFVVSVILVCSQLLRYTYLIGQTSKTTPADTSKKTAQKLQPQEDRPKLELPDVLIYGTDRSVRVSGDKLDRSHEDVKLVAPIIKYQAATSESKVENHKDYFQSQKKGIDSRTVLQMDAGRFQQFNIEASQWRETKNYNYSLRGSYERSNGQYENSQYYQGSIKAQLGIRLSSNFIISSRGNFRLFDYGLYGAQYENLQRKTNGGKIKIDAHWSITAEQSADFSVYFQQNHCKDDDANNYRSKLIERNIELFSNYDIKFRSIPIFIRGLYEYQKLNKVTIDSVNSQKYIQLKSWSSFKVKQYFIIKPGILFEHLDLNNSFSAYQFSPDIEIIVTPITKFGILLKGTRGYYPVNYANFCEKNPFISHETDFIPVKKELELKLGFEFHPASGVSLGSEVIRQNWKNYAFWSREAEVGLFQLSFLEKVTLTVFNFQSQFTISPKIKFDAGVQINFDSIENDSLAINDNYIPYLERFRFPFNFEYKINETTQALLTFLWIGPRYVDLNNDEKLSNFGLLSFHFEKQLIKNLSVFVEGNNLLNQKYELWQKYPGMGFYFEVGMKGNW